MSLSPNLSTPFSNTKLRTPDNTCNTSGMCSVCQRRIKNNGNTGQDLTQTALRISPEIHSPVHVTPGCLLLKYWLGEQSGHLILRPQKILCKSE
jgi:hypothetical protein